MAPDFDTHKKQSKFLKFIYVLNTFRRRPDRKWDIRFHRRTDVYRLHVRRQNEGSTSARISKVPSKMFAMDTDTRVATPISFVYLFCLLRRHICCRAIKTIIGVTAIDYQCLTEEIGQSEIICFQWRLTVSHSVNPQFGHNPIPTVFSIERLVSDLKVDSKFTIIWPAEVRSWSRKRVLIIRWFCWSG